MEIIEERKSKRGGRRPGAGRKPGKVIDESMRRRRHTVRLPVWLINWLKLRPKLYGLSQGKLIEKSIYDLYETDIKGFLKECDKEFCEANLKNRKGD